MALDYSVLQGIDPGGAFFRGQEAVRAEQERNMLRQMQMEQMAAQRENMLAQRQEREAQAVARRAQEQRAADRQRLLSGAAAALRQGGYPLNRDVLNQILASAVEADEPTLYKFATETMKALDEEDLYKREATRFGLPGGAAPAAPSVMRQPAAAMPTAPGNLLAGTPYDIGMGAPAPVNALAAPPPAAAPAGAGFTREQVQQMLTSPSARIREQGKALAATLPKETAPPAPSEVVRLNRELAEAQAAGNTALVANIQARIARLTEKPQPTQVIIPPQEKAEKAARGAMLVKDFEAVKQTAAIAAKTLPAIDSNLAILDKGFDTGFGTEAKTAAARVLSALGVKDAEKYAANSETFLANATQGVLQRQLEQKGPQTEADAQRITQTGAQLGNTKTGNRFLLSVAKAQLKRDVDQRNFYASWYKKNGTYDGAEDAWLEGEGGKSLFDRPELKPYADMTPTQTPAAGRARPSLDQIFKRKGQGGG